MIRVVLVCLLAAMAVSSCGIKGDPLPVESEE
jgi:hypothetical protein